MTSVKGMMFTLREYQKWLPEIGSRFCVIMSLSFFDGGLPVVVIEIDIVHETRLVRVFLVTSTRTTDCYHLQQFQLYCLYLRTYIFFLHIALYYLHRFELRLYFRAESQSFFSYTQNILFVMPVIKKSLSELLRGSARVLLLNHNLLSIMNVDALLRGLRVKAQTIEGVPASSRLFTLHS